MKNIDTIAAISTALNESGIGIVRISGDDAISIADKIFIGKKSLKDVDTHTINYGHICVCGEIVDEVLVMLMKAPRTYTGEDTVEINCHGGILVVSRVLKEIIKAGARIAEPGEFTKRAFLNGKMDLSKAEAVIDIINAKNEYALKSGIKQLSGSLKFKIDEIRKKILNEIAFIEAALDDPEHYSLDKYPKKLNKIMNFLIEDLDKLIRSFENGKIIKEGIDTVIIGKPNVGKSSLLNLLIGEERAIVTDIEGTTRDTITENINLSGISLNITDTAGIRESSDIVEQIGINKAKDAAKDADFIICMIDVSKELDNEDIKILELTNNKKSVILLNKSDLSNKISIENISKYTNSEVINFSIKEERGLENLENIIKNMFYKGNLNFNDQVYITNIRHIESLQEAKTSLEMVISSIEEDLPEDFYSIDLLNAYEELGSITGETVDDDVVNEIFSKFCMGK